MNGIRLIQYIHEQYTMPYTAVYGVVTSAVYRSYKKPYIRKRLVYVSYNGSYKKPFFTEQYVAVFGGKEALLTVPLACREAVPPKSG